MKNSYTLERRNDGHIWVNIQPLMADIQKNYDSLMAMDTSEFSQSDHDVLELKIMGMHQVYQFLGALAMEHKLKEEALFQAGVDDINKQINESIGKVTIHTIQ